MTAVSRRMILSAMAEFAGRESSQLWREQRAKGFSADFVEAQRCLMPPESSASEQTLIRPI